MRKKVSLVPILYLCIFAAFVLCSGCRSNAKVKSVSRDPAEKYLAKKRETPLVEKKEILPSFFEKLKGIKKKPVIFSTPYGDIEKGSPMSEIMNIFGNPHYISTRNKSEVWYYYFGNNKQIFVHFMNGKVMRVKGRKDSEPNL